MMRTLINTLCDEWKTVERQIEELGDELEWISAWDAGCTRIRQIPGDRARGCPRYRRCDQQRCCFPQGPGVRCLARDCARQYSTGGNTNLLGISKRGSVYPRKILIHGARAAVLCIKRDRRRSERGSIASKLGRTRTSL